MKFLFGLVMCCVCGSLAAEVTKISLKWNPLLCVDTCTRQLEPWFRQLPQVSDVKFSGPNGYVVLYWRANTTFEFQTVDNVMQRIGLSWEVLDNRISMRGTITHDDQNFYIHSIGDTTTFILIGNPPTSSTNYVIPYSQYNRPLSDAVKKQLLEAQRLSRVVALDGVIFQPEVLPQSVVVGSIRMDE